MNGSPKADVVVQSRTDRETVRFTLKWTIDKVRSIKNRKSKLCSDGITMKELGMGTTYQGRWRIYLCASLVDGDKKESDGSQQVFFLAFLKLGAEQRGVPASGNHLDTEMTATIIFPRQVSKSSVQPIHSSQEISNFVSRMFTGKTLDTTLDTVTWQGSFSDGPPEERGSPGCFVSHRSLFGTKDNPGLLKDDCVTIIMDVLLYKDPVMSRIPTVPIMSVTERCRNFALRQAKLLGTDQSADFVLQSRDGKEFSVDRFLLRAHSPVFAAMLTHDTKEKQTSRCELTDIDGESVELLLEYVYGCEIANISEKNAEKVLIAADKYQITDLRAVCEGILANSVSADNAMHCLVLSSQRDLTTLKEAALKVIPKNLGTVLRSPAMEEAMQSDPELIRTVTQHCSKRMRVVEESE